MVTSLNSGSPAAAPRAGATDSGSGALDLFRFSDSPVFEALKLSRMDARAT